MITAMNCDVATPDQLKCDVVVPSIVDHAGNVRVVAEITIGHKSKVKIFPAMRDFDYLMSRRRKENVNIVMRVELV